MRRVWAQCVKELAQFRRDKLTVALAFVLPLISFFLFGYATRLEMKDIPVAVQDLDNSPFSRAYIERLFANAQLKPVSWDSGAHEVKFASAGKFAGAGKPVTSSMIAVAPVTATADIVKQALDTGAAQAVVIVPPDFERDFRAGRPAAVQVLIDGTDVNNARVIKNSIIATTLSYQRTIGVYPSKQPVRLDMRLWFNPGRKESLYVVPGVFGIVLWIYPSLLAALAMSKENEQGTMLQAYASSISAVELVAGKALAYLFVGLMEAVLIIGLAAVLFGLGFAGDPTPFLLGTLLFITASVLFGVMLGAGASTQSAAVQAVATGGFTTALLLSGFLYPVRNIVFPLSLLSYLVPARYYISLSRDAFVRGSGWPGSWYMPLAILIAAALMFRAAAGRLRKMQIKG